jgi:hypothetical protein
MVTFTKVTEKQQHKMQGRRLSFATVLLAILLTGCRDPLDVDTSDVQIPEIKLLRLEQDLFSLGNSAVSSGTAALRQKYGVWYEHYIMSFMNRRGTADTNYAASVLAYISDRDVRGAFVQSQRLFNDNEIGRLKTEVDEMARRFHYHFPQRALPARLITCTTGWNYAFAYMDSALIVSLDMYLGDTSQYYKMLRYPQYQVRRMNTQHLPADIARGWLLTEFDTMPANNVLISHAIFYGKLYYAVEALLPDAHDSLVIGYSGKQLKYCDEYEKKLWGYMAANNRLFANDLNVVRELTGEGPFTGAISKDCPPRIAMWVGWQIVRSYMKKNEKVTLAELMAEPDAQMILNKSKYRP